VIALITLHLTVSGAVRDAERRMMRVARRQRLAEVEHSEQMEYEADGRDTRFTRDQLDAFMGNANVQLDSPRRARVRWP